MDILSKASTGKGIILTVKVVPQSSKTAVCGLLGGMIKIKLSSAPQKGKANRQLTEFLAECLNVKKNAVKIISGHGSAVKQIRIAGITEKLLWNRLGLADK